MGKDFHRIESAGRQLLALSRLSIEGVIDSKLQVDEIDWPIVFYLAKNHSLIGIVLGGIEHLPKEKLPDKELLLQWLGQTEYIKSQNIVITKVIKKIVAIFENEGIQGVVLKGQGLACLYPRSELRANGDIDYLLINVETSTWLIKKVLKMASSDSKYLHATYHHCDFGNFSGVEVEVHWRASWMFNPLTNKRLQRIMKGLLEQGNVECGGWKMPSLAFQRIYNLVHIYRHLFSTGISMKQLVDYYIVLRASANVCNNDVDDLQKKALIRQLKELHMERFVSALMWIMYEYMGVPKDWLIFEPDAKRGCCLWSEILKSRDDSLKSKNETGNIHFFGNVYFKMKKSIRLFRFGPGEVFFSLIWRIWHALYWMPKYKLIYTMSNSL